MITTYLSLGSNEGNRQETLQKALVALELACGPIRAQSSVYETKAWGLQEQPDFLNMAVEMETMMDPYYLLDAIHGVERDLHRQRIVKWGQRTIDIDILYYGELVRDTPALIIPHAMLRMRRFVLVPLAEIAPDFVDPVTGQSVAELLAICPDALEVHRVA